jgi:hypothetical protein
VVYQRPKERRNGAKETVGHGILKEFLKANSSEVINMLMTEWNWEDALEVRWEEGREEGLEEGQNMILKLMRQGYSVEQIEAELAAIKPAGSDITGK